MQLEVLALREALGQGNTYTVPITDQPASAIDGGAPRTFSLGNLGAGVAGAADEKEETRPFTPHTHQRRPLGHSGATSENVVAASRETFNKELLSCSLDGFRHRAAAAFR